MPRSAPLPGLQIEDEAARTLKRYLARRVKDDLHGPEGYDLSGGRHRPYPPGVDPDAEGVHSAQREVNPLVELRVPFTLTRWAVDDVARGSNDPDWQPLKDAARQIALAEDRWSSTATRPQASTASRETSNPSWPCPRMLRIIRRAVARAVSQLRLAGVNGPYALVLGIAAFTAAIGGAEDGYPIAKHLEKLVDPGRSGARPWKAARGDQGAAAISTCISDRTSPSAICRMMPKPSPCIFRKR